MVRHKGWVCAVVQLSGNGRKIDRKKLQTSASMLGLAAGAIGWSGLANAASEETHARIMLLPEHYELTDGNVVLFKLETGEELTLNPDQYLIMQDGLLLITDELVQASIQSLPVMGSVRSELLRDLSEMPTSTESEVALATPEQARSILDGDAPRLFDEVSIERFELAQASEDQNEGSPAFSEGWEQVEGGVIAGGFLTMLALLSNSPEEEREPEREPEPEPEPAVITVPWDPNDSPGVMPQPLNNYISFDFANGIAPLTSVTLTGAQGLALSPATSSGILTWSNSVQNSGTTSWTAQTTLIRVQALNASGDTAVETVRLVGQLILGDDDVASGASSVTIIGSVGDDYVGYSAASAGATDPIGFLASTSSAKPTAKISLGVGNDYLNLDSYAANREGKLEVDLGEGNNSFVADDFLGNQGGVVNILTGNGDDQLDLLGWYNFNQQGEATISLGNGRNSLQLGPGAASQTGVFTYIGGTGADNLEIGTNFVNDFGKATINLGVDAVGDSITFGGDVAKTNGSVVINNFNPLHDTIDVPGSTGNIELVQAGADVIVSNTPTFGMSFEFKTTNVDIISITTNTAIF